MKSSKLSFEGYDIREALYRNKDSIKGIIAILAGINVVIGVDWKTLLISLGAAVVSLSIKLLGDAVDFYFSEVDL